MVTWKYKARMVSFKIGRRGTSINKPPRSVYSKSPTVRIFHHDWRIARRSFFPAKIRDMFLNPPLFLRKGETEVRKKEKTCSQKTCRRPGKEIKQGAVRDFSTIPISIPNFGAWKYRKKTSEN
jgi:hypothetical protein